MTNALRCPACGEAMERSAERCPSCGFDSRVFGFLQARLDEFEQRLASLEIAVGVGKHAATLARHVSRRRESEARAAEVIVLVALPVGLLLLAHYALMVFVGALNPRHMLLTSVAIPLPFGFLVAAGGLNRFAWWLLGSLALAFAATLGMNVVSTWMHASAVWPQSAQEIWEFGTYLASIALSHAAGLILGVVFWQWVTRGEALLSRARWQYRVARFLVGRHYDPERAHRAAVEFLTIARMLIALAAIAGSVYSGWLRLRI